MFTTGETWEDDFNPWTAQVTTWDGLIFERLAYVTPTGQIIPWLATNWTLVTSYALVNRSGTIVKVPAPAIIFWLRHNVTFSNGDPFNATAVWYSLAITKAYPALGYAGPLIANISIINPYEIEVVYDSNNTILDLFDTLISPEVDPKVVGSIFPLEQLPNGTVVPLNKTGNPAAWPDLNPVGTGPYVVYSFSSQMVIFKARSNYWMPGEPRIETIYFPAYPSATVAVENLLEGQFTWATLFTTNITIYHAKNPACYQYGLDSNNTAPDMLIINDLKWPFNYTALRQAISMVINRTYLINDIYAGLAFYSPAVPMAPGTLYMLNSTVLSMAEELAPREPNVSGAIQLLESAGFKYVNGQLYAPNGTDLSTMTFTIIAPSGSTGYDAEATAIAEELKAIGLNVEPLTLPWGEWSTSMKTADFDMGIIWDLDTSPLWVPSTIFESYYYGWGPYHNETPPIGKGETSWTFAQNEIERLNLSQYPQLPELVHEANYYYAVNYTKYEQIINTLAYWWAKLMPAVPTVDAVDVYEYNNCTVEGWPTPSHYYWIASIIEDHNILPVVLALKLSNESGLPEPWWYYIQAFTPQQVPEQWKVSNDPFITVTTVTTTPVTTTTTTSTTTTTTTLSTTHVTSVTSVSTAVSTTTVTSTGTTTVTKTITVTKASAAYIAAAVVITAIVVGLVVWALMRR